MAKKIIVGEEYWDLRTNTCKIVYKVVGVTSDFIIVERPLRHFSTIKFDTKKGFVQKVVPVGDFEVNFIRTDDPQVRNLKINRIMVRKIKEAVALASSTPWPLSFKEALEFIKENM